MSIYNGWDSIHWKFVRIVLTHFDFYLYLALLASWHGCLTLRFILFNRLSWSPTTTTAAFHSICSTIINLFKHVSVKDLFNIIVRTNTTCFVELITKKMSYSSESCRCLEDAFQQKCYIFWRILFNTC